MFSPLQNYGTFKIQKNLCTVLSQTTSGKACAHDKRTKREKERPERAASSQPMATPWVSAYKRQRPVRAKVWAHLLFITFALTGRRCGTYVNPGRCPGLWTCWAFSPCRAARMSRIAKIRLIRTRRIRAARQFVNSLNSLLRRLRPASNCGAARNPVAKIRLIRTAASATNKLWRSP